MFKGSRSKTISKKVRKSRKLCYRLVYTTKRLTLTTLLYFPLRFQSLIGSWYFPPWTDAKAQRSWLASFKCAHNYDDCGARWVLLNLTLDDSRQLFQHTCAKSLVLPKLPNSHWLNIRDHQNYEKCLPLNMKLEIKRKIDCRWNGAHFVFFKTFMHMTWTEIYNTGRKCIQVSVFQINFKVEKLEIRREISIK